MSEFNVGDIEEVTADEDVDPDILIAEEEEARMTRIQSARQRIEGLKDDQDTSDV